MYIKSVQELKTEVKNEIEKSINSKLKTEILGIQVQETGYAGVVSITVLFKNDNGTASGLLKYDGENNTYVLMAPMMVKFNKKEDKKNA